MPFSIRTIKYSLWIVGLVGSCLAGYSILRNLIPLPDDLPPFFWMRVLILIYFLFVSIFALGNAFAIENTATQHTWSNLRALCGAMMLTVIMLPLGYLLRLLLETRDVRRFFNAPNLAMRKSED